MACEHTDGLLCLGNWSVEGAPLCSIKGTASHTWPGSPQAIVPSPTVDTIRSEAPNGTMSSVFGDGRALGEASLLDGVWALASTGRVWAWYLRPEHGFRIMMQKISTILFLSFL